MSAGVLRDHVDPDLIDTAGMELSSTLHGLRLPARAAARGPRLGSRTDRAVGGGRRRSTERPSSTRAASTRPCSPTGRTSTSSCGCGSAGGRCAFCPDARGTHAHSATLGSGSAAKNRLMGFGRGYVLRKWSVARGSRALRVLAEEASLCAGQALIDRNAVGLTRARSGMRGLRAAVFGYPGDLLRSYDRRACEATFGAGWRGGVACARRREEPPREGLMRHLTPGRAWSPSGDRGFDAALTAAPRIRSRPGTATSLLLGGMFSGSGADARRPRAAGGRVAGGDPVARTGAHDGDNRGSGGRCSGPGR